MATQQPSMQRSQIKRKQNKKRPDTPLQTTNKYVRASNNLHTNVESEYVGASNNLHTNVETTSEYVGASNNLHTDVKSEYVGASNNLHTDVDIQQIYDNEIAMALAMNINDDKHKVDILETNIPKAVSAEQDHELARILEEIQEFEAKEYLKKNGNAYAKELNLDNIMAKQMEEDSKIRQRMEQNNKLYTWRHEQLEQDIEYSQLLAEHDEETTNQHQINESNNTDEPMIIDQIPQPSNTIDQIPQLSNTIDQIPQTREELRKARLYYFNNIIH